MDRSDNLRVAERFLLVPPVPARFGSAAVALCDFSDRGARFRHDQPVDTGAKMMLQVVVPGLAGPVSLEALVVWTQADASAVGARYVTGVRTYGAAAEVDALLNYLKASTRSNRIEELRSTERFLVTPCLAATFDGFPAHIENLSARGARIETSEPLAPQSTGTLRFTLGESSLDISITAAVAWSGVKALYRDGRFTYRSGLAINERPELLRLAIGKLCELGQATLDTQSLRLKLKTLRARARELARPHAQPLDASLPVDQVLVVQGVREELRLNPDEAVYWYGRARILIRDPATRLLAPPIADHPDALAVWEYLDRSVDPSVIERIFGL
jgi:hypothetical protein